MILKLLLCRAPTMIKSALQRALPTKNHLDARTASTTARPQGIICCRSLEEDRDSKSICNGTHKNAAKSLKKIWQRFHGSYSYTSMLYFSRAFILSIITGTQGVMQESKTYLVIILRRRRRDEIDSIQLSLA